MWTKTPLICSFIVCFTAHMELSLFISVAAILFTATFCVDWLFPELQLTVKLFCLLPNGPPSSHSHGTKWNLLFGGGGGQRSGWGWAPLVHLEANYCSPGHLETSWSRVPCREGKRAVVLTTCGCYSGAPILKVLIMNSIKIYNGRVISTMSKKRIIES